MGVEFTYSRTGKRRGLLIVYDGNDDMTIETVCKEETVTEPANHCHNLIYRGDGIVIVPAPQNIVTIVTVEFCPPVPRFLASKRTRPLYTRPSAQKSRCGRFVNRIGRGYTIGKKPHGISRQSIGIAAVNFQDRFHCRRKQRHLKEPLRFTSDGNADRRTAWLRRFPEVCIVAAIRGCRVHLFQILASKTGLLK